MRTRKTLFSLLMASLSLGAMAQDKVLMKINNKPVYKSDFEYLYHKNTEGSASKPMDVKEYVDLFVNYRLKVEEAENQGLDKDPKFINEYKSYRNQLVRPYLEDTTSINVVAKDIYDRLGQNIEVSHILIAFDRSKETLLPADTLAAYNKAMEIRARLFGTKKKKAESFEVVAFEASEDPGAKMGERAGYLGWTTSLMFVAPFEDAMYALNVGDISMPVRSRFGYHLIKVHNKRQDGGEINAAHIMFSYPSVKRRGDKPTQAELDSVQQVAMGVYAKLQAGGSYDELCKEYSADKVSAQKGGDLGWFSFTSRFPRVFVDQAFSLKKEGEYTKPFATEFGYHIVKLLGTKPRESWEQSATGVKDMLKRSDFYTKVLAEETKTLEKDFKTTLDVGEYAKLQTIANQYYPTDSLFAAKVVDKNATLLSVADQRFPVGDFTTYLLQTPVQSNMSTDALTLALDAFKKQQLEKAHEASIEKTHPDLVRLSQEYHDGILLFNVMNQEVWDKALKDSVGLEKQFNDNRSKYVWDQSKFKGVAVVAKDQASMDKVAKLYKNIKDTDKLVEELKVVAKNDSTLQIKVERGVWAKNENSYVDKQIYKLKDVTVKENAKYPIYQVFGKMLKKPESFKDIKGPVVSDYQNWLETTWIKSLKDKYPVVIDEEVLKTVK